MTPVSTSMGATASLTHDIWRPPAAHLLGRPVVSIMAPETVAPDFPLRRFPHILPVRRRDGGTRTAMRTITGWQRCGNAR